MPWEDEKAKEANIQRLITLQKEMGFDLLWVGILIAMNLQTSFLTPPFGFSIFYLKGVAPPGVTTEQLYKGVIPYVALQLTALILIIFFPEISSWLLKIIGS